MHVFRKQEDYGRLQDPSVTAKAVAGESREGMLAIVKL